MTTTKNLRKLTIGLTTAAILTAGVGVANAYVTGNLIGGTAALAAAQQSGWQGVTRVPVRIDFGKGWVSKAELNYPRNAKGRLQWAPPLLELAMDRKYLQ